MNTDATRAHIDAETMAAWADHGLSADAAAEVELHLSNCERCQEVLAAFVRSAPMAGAVVIPFWARRPVQWSAAGLAAAAALVAMVWIGRPPATPTAESTVATRSVATEPPPVSASAPEELRRDKPASASVAPRKEKSASTADLRRDKPASALEDRAAANEVASKKAAPPKAEGRAAMPAVAPPLPPPAAVQAALPPPPPVTVTGAAPVVTPVGASRPFAMSESGAMDAITAIPVIEIVAPESSSSAFRSAVGGAGRGGGGARALSPNAVPARWRIVAGIHVERSMDAGGTWTALPIEPELKTTLKAGVATSQFNCWLVGREGVVLVTTDGRTFRRVSLPEAVHLTAVTATDALRAMVTAIDGRTFSTNDGGLTWK